MNRLVVRDVPPAVSALQDACAYLAACLPPVANAVVHATREVRAADTFAASARDSAAYAAEVAVAAKDVATRAVLAGSAAGAADAADVAASAVRLAARVAHWAADAAHPAAAAAAVANEAEAAADEVLSAATSVRADGAADLADAVRAAADVAVRALREAERVFTTLATGQARPRVVASTVRPPGVLTRRVLSVASALLPFGDRARYAEEWLSLLTELPTRRARAGHLFSILRGAPRQAWTLRRPLKHVPPA
ncbi:hypothetical protein [Actinomadura madurae]|uniref:hypothetical protein n=1 Tax=Actinomadura madurae TaxID=1993 RepID=UPI0020D24912|nr:hypothetical protein [Actinomadura madurae]MCP9951769.1 hypothetical protein [Actinomadura madurae]MCP9981008.1 hypothetical protein [Actinomadura madurae]MCQ0007490.1 hypothetical protein [Actinomadura madurae]